MKNTGIYAITNITNNKCYIGSAKSIKKRIREHLHYFKHNKHHSIYLQRSYNKYGRSSFEFSVLEYCKEEELLIREQYYIDTLRPHYNICKVAGNSLGVKRSEETKRKLSLSHMGQKAWNKGIPRTKEQNLAHSRKLLGRPSKKKKSVVQLDLEGNFIAEFDSIVEAKVATNTCYIHGVLSGKRKTANKFIWKYKAEYQPAS